MMRVYIFTMAVTMVLRTLHAGLRSGGYSLTGFVVFGASDRIGVVRRKQDALLRILRPIKRLAKLIHSDGYDEF